MQTVGRAIGKNCGFTIHLMAIVALLAGVAIAPQVMAQSAGQQKFKTPQAAAAALVEAVKNRDKAMALKVLGTNAEGLFNTGDESVDVSQHSYSSTSISRCIGW